MNIFFIFHQLKITSFDITYYAKKKQPKKKIKDIILNTLQLKK